MRAEANGKIQRTFAPSPPTGCAKDAPARRQVPPRVPQSTPRASWPWFWAGRGGATFCPPAPLFCHLRQICLAGICFCAMTITRTPRKGRRGGGSKSKRKPIVHATPEQKATAVRDYAQLLAGEKPTQKQLKQLAQKHGRHLKSIQGWHRAWTKDPIDGLRNRKVGNKNASKLTPTKVAKVRKVMEENRRTTGRQLSAKLKPLGVKSLRTALSYRKYLGYRGRIRRKKTWLTEAHLQARWRHAETYKNEHCLPCHEKILQKGEGERI